MSYPNPIQKILEQQGYLVIDGALATELEARGASLKDVLWSAKLLMENPELIRQVHYDYLVHGADVIITASYQATFEGFAVKGWTKAQGKTLFQRSIQLAKEARALFWEEIKPQNRIWPLVAASIGPYGAMLADGSEYRGNYGLKVHELAAFHRPRLEALLDSGADLIAFETIPSIQEAEAICRLLENYENTCAWLSFSCKDEEHIRDGTPFQQAVRWVAKANQVAAVGINCTAPELINPLLDCMKNETSKPIIVYPNSGENWDAIKKCWVKDAQPTDWENKIRQWYNKGARLIGGCCRTSPKDIQMIQKSLRKLH